MAHTATILVKLPCKGDGRQTDFTSEKVKLAGFQWSFGGKIVDNFIFIHIKDLKIHCAPEKKTSIGNCEAFGKIMALASNSDNHCSQPWSHSFDMNRSSTEPVEQYCHTLFPSGTRLVVEDADEKFCQLEVQVNVMHYKLIDLSDSESPLIQSPDDAVQVDVEGKKLWLSKAFLSINSLFFKSAFNSNLEENLTGRCELEGVKFDEFLHCLCLLYGIHVEIDDNSLQYLMRLGDYLQCDLIISHCRHSLFQSKIPVEKKLEWVDRLGLHSTTKQLLKTMDSAALKKIVNSGTLLDMSVVTNREIMSRITELLD